MGVCLPRLFTACVAVAALLAAGPASSNPAEPHENSSYSQLERFAAALKAQSERALAAASQAAAHALREGERALAEAETDLAPQMRTFDTMLNEEKDRLAMIGKDTAARFEAWKTEALQYWSQSFAKLSRSALAALDRFRDWIAKHAVTGKQTETNV